MHDLEMGLGRRRGLAATAVWLLDVDELPLEMKTAEEMDVPGAPVTPAPAHAECNRPAPQAREARELSPAIRLLSMVTRHLDVPHLTVHAERPRAAVCVQHLRGSEPSESRESRAAPRPPPSATPPSCPPGACRSRERNRRGLGLWRSTLLAVVARRDAAPMKRLGMDLQPHLLGGGRHLGGQHAGVAHSGEADTCNASAPRSVRGVVSREGRGPEQRGPWLTTERVTGRAQAGPARLNWADLTAMLRPDTVRGTLGRLIRVTRRPEVM